MQKDDICTNYTKLSELQKQIEELEGKMTEKMGEWEELNDKLSKY